MRIGMGIILLVVIAAGQSWAGNVDWNVNVSLGSGRAEPAPVYYPPPPVVVSGPPIGTVIVSEPPLFLAPPQLGFWVAVNVPYDMVYIDGYYFLSHGNYWYASPRHNGPWTVVVHEHLPPRLRQHKYSKIREHRDKEYKRYAQEGPNYRGQPYRPEHRKGKGDDRGKGNREHSGRGNWEDAGKGKGHR